MPVERALLISQPAGDVLPVALLGTGEGAKDGLADPGPDILVAHRKAHRRKLRLRGEELGVRAGNRGQQVALAEQDGVIFLAEPDHRIEPPRVRHWRADPEMREPDHPRTGKTGRQPDDAFVGQQQQLFHELRKQREAVEQFEIDHVQAAVFLAVQFVATRFIAVQVLRRDIHGQARVERADVPAAAFQRIANGRSCLAQAVERLHDRLQRLPLGNPQAEIGATQPGGGSFEQLADGANRDQREGIEQIAFRQADFAEQGAGLSAQIDHQFAVARQELGEGDMVRTVRAVRPEWRVLVASNEVHAGIPPAAEPVCPTRIAGPPQSPCAQSSHSWTQIHS